MFILYYYDIYMFIGRRAEGEREVKAALPISVGITYTFCLRNENVYILRRMLTNAGFYEPHQKHSEEFF